MPGNMEAFILLAEIHQKEGDSAQAKSTLNAAYENNKINPDSLLMLSKYLLSRDLNQA